MKIAFIKGKISDKKDKEKKKLKKKLLTNMFLSDDQKKKILKELKLRNNIKSFIVSSPDIHLKRKEYKLNTFDQLVNHFENQDPSGKTTGCGCVLCLMRNNEYITNSYCKSYKKELSKHFSIDHVFKSKLTPFLEQKGAILTHESIEKPDILNRFGSVLMKKASKLNKERQKEFAKSISGKTRKSMPIHIVEEIASPVVMKERLDTRLSKLQSDYNSYLKEFENWRKGRIMMQQILGL